MFVRTTDPLYPKRKAWKMLKFIAVEYDGVAEKLIEPVNMCDSFDPTGAISSILQTGPGNGVGRVVEFQYHDVVPFDGVHQID